MDHFCSKPINPHGKNISWKSVCVCLQTIMKITWVNAWKWFECCLAQGKSSMLLLLLWLLLVAVVSPSLTVVVSLQLAELPTHISWKYLTSLITNGSRALWFKVSDGMRSPGARNREMNDLALNTTVSGTKALILFMATGKIELMWQSFMDHFQGDCTCLGRRCSGQFPGALTEDPN